MIPSVFERMVAKRQSGEGVMEPFCMFMKTGDLCRLLQQSWLCTIWGLPSGDTASSSSSGCCCAALAYACVVLS